MTEREAGILAMRYGIDGQTPKHQNEIGEKYGVSGARISQIEPKCINKLRRQSFKKLQKCFDKVSYYEAGIAARDELIINIDPSYNRL